MALRSSALLGLGCSLLLLAACGSDHHRKLDKDAEAILADGEVPEPDEEDSGSDPVEPKDAAVTPKPDAALDAQTSDAGPDATTQEDTGAEPDATETDSSTPDGDTPDTAVEPDAAADTSVPVPDHPLAGKYAARTLLYARQKSTLQGGELDLVSKGVLISTVEIDKAGHATEQYCVFEIGGEVSSWTAPSAMQKVAKSDIVLSAEGDHYVRAESAHKLALSWAPGAVPEGCVAGQPHSSGCLCPSNDKLPTDRNDCRVRDLDGDGTPGAEMYIGIQPSEALDAEGALVTLNIVANLSIGWKLPNAAAAKLVGGVSGGFDQSELSREVDPNLPIEAGPIFNAMCPGELGHIELVKGDFDCAALIAHRAENSETYGLFDVALDGTKPEPAVCPDPGCSGDNDGDGTLNCEDKCPADATKSANAGICGCGTPDVDTDSDGTLDCQDGCPSDPLKPVPGGCGCGVIDADSDEDRTPDCNDGCPNDGAKLTPGTCGCGTADTNSDGDGEPDCRDTCPNNAPKTAPGACGCTAPDTDTDTDGTPDCNDTCPNNAPKTAPGVCGCATADTDSDGDGTPNCNDACADDPKKNTVGRCGCNVVDVDTDNDGQYDCEEECDTNPGKTAPGVCGCAVADTNSDTDSVPDCNEECDTDPGKTAPGACGCGIPDTNSDTDAVPDCNEQCDTDPNKTAPGACGCGVADTDSDTDGTPNCNDGCPSDRGKTAPGVCGCGVADQDLNGDGRPDCSDECPNDPAKLAPGVCGCGVADVNADNDARFACQEECDSDPNKIARGQCGCGVADTDSDSDGVANCNDACPTNPNKSANTQCGCSWPGADVDTDRDGTLDCFDGCPSDGSKQSPGTCGCGVADTNSDGDSEPNCRDQCPNNAPKTAPGLCGCAVADTNTDGDSAPDCTDQCPNNAPKTAPGVCGCAVADTNSDNDSAPDCTDQCKNDPGKIVPGVCGCGVADTDSDSDGTPDCTDECDNNRALQKAGLCGCVACAESPLIGTYAVRTNVFSKQTTGAGASDHEETQGINYSIIKIEPGPQGGLRLTDRQCWAQTIPNGGTGAFSWSKPAWVQAMPAMVRDLSWNVSDNTFTRPAVLTRLGWDPARQPASCSSSSTPVQPWRSQWGSTCRCTAPASNLPPYDTNASANTYDCRLADTDGDLQPGVSSIGALSAPALGSEANDGLATVYSVSNLLDTWRITVDAQRRHTATIDDQSEAQIVGCTGIACLGVPGSPPPSRACPARFNRASFVPVDPSTTCATVISQRNQLWGANPAWPGAGATECPFPAWQ